MKKLIFGISITLGLLFVSASQVSAAVRCETQYGGNQVCVTTGQLQINKKIWAPNYSEYRDNLYITDYQFKTADFVTFKLIVKNVGDNTLTNVKIVDSLPSFLFFTGGSTSEYKKDKLNPGEEWVIDGVKTQVVSDSQLNADRICGVNTAEVTADGNQHDKDTAELCVTKKILGLKKLPETGVNTPVIIFGASLAVAMLGLALIRVGKKIA